MSRTNRGRVDVFLESDDETVAQRPDVSPVGARKTSRCPHPHGEIAQRHDSAFLYDELLKPPPMIRTGDSSTARGEREQNSLTGLELATIAAKQPALQFRIRRRVTQPDRDHGARKILALNDALVRVFD